MVESKSRSLRHRLPLLVAVFLAFGPSFSPVLSLCPNITQATDRPRRPWLSHPIPSAAIARRSLAVQKVWRTTDGQEDGRSHGGREGGNFFRLSSGASSDSECRSGAVHDYSGRGGRARVPLPLQQPSLRTTLLISVTPYAPLQ